GLASGPPAGGLPGPTPGPLGQQAAAVEPAEKDQPLPLAPGESGLCIPLPLVLHDELVRRRAAPTIGIGPRAHAHAPSDVATGDNVLGRSIGSAGAASAGAASGSADVTGVGGRPGADTACGHPTEVVDDDDRAAEEGDGHPGDLDAEHQPLDGLDNRPFCRGFHGAPLPSGCAVTGRPGAPGAPAVGAAAAAESTAGAAPVAPQFISPPGDAGR